MPTPREFPRAILVMGREPKNRRRVQRVRREYEANKTRLLVRAFDSHFKVTP